MRRHDVTRAWPLHATAVAALCLRLLQLGDESIWIDEWTTVTLAKSSVLDILRDRSQSVNAPLYFILLHFWSSVFGYSEFAIRLPSVLFGTLSVFLVFLLARDLFDRTVGIVSAILLTVSLFHIRHSQDARGYTLLAALILLSTFFFVRLFRGYRWSSFGYVVASSLLVYTHFYGLLAIVAQNVHMLTLWGVGRETNSLTMRRWLRLQLVLLVMFAPWSIFLLDQVKTIQSGFWIPEPTIASLKETFLDYSNGRTDLLLAFAVLASIGLIAGLKTHARSVWLLAMLIVTALLVPFALSKISAPVYYTRYTVAASLAFVVLVAAGVQRIPLRHLRTAALVAIVAVSIAGLRPYYGEQTKAPWRELARDVDRQATPNDLLLFNDGSYADLMLDYYSTRTDLDGRGFNLGVVLPTEQASQSKTESVEALESIIQHRARVWLVLYKSNDTSGRILSRLATLRREVSHRNYGGIELYVFQ